MNDKIVKTDYILENETPEQAFERIMGEPYDSNKYDLRVGEGAMDDGYDNPISTIEIVEKQQSIVDGIDVSTLSEEELGKILDNAPDANAVYMNDPVPGYVIDGKQAGYQDIQNAYNALVQGNDTENINQTVTNDTENINQTVPNVDTTTAQQEQDPVLIEYANSGYGKNADGWYFNPNTDEYDESYDPHNDPLFNKDLVNDKDPVLVEYANSGYGKNADGWYFNPNTDEYDESYDPHNDPLFNKDLKQETKTNEELLREYMRLMFSMSDILGKDPYLGVEKESLPDTMDPEKKEEFEKFRARVGEIASLDKTVPEKYAQILGEINDIRNAMGKILNIEPYPGIENEYEHAVKFQLDDFEKEHFADLREKLNGIKEQYPEMFLNVISKDNTKDQESSKDDNDQHKPNPETGYAVGGFQPPAAIDEPVDTNDQHKPNPETGYAVGGFQPPAAVDAPVQTNDQPTPPPLPDQPQPEQQQTASKKEKAMEALKKGLAFAGGMVVGAGLSCVPGVGVIRMGISAVKITGSVVNTWANKHPDGKVAQIRDAALDKVPQPIKDKLVAFNKKMHSTPLNAFVNGVAVGYIAGNVFEMVTGNTLFEAAKERLTPLNADEAQALDAAKNAATQTTDVQPTPGPEPTPTVADTQTTVVPQVTPDVPTAPDYTQLTDMVKSGQPVDISGLEFGKVSSDALNSVHLKNIVGNGATFFKEAVAPDGTVMWAFKQPNGMYYAWFSKDEILEELAKAAENTAGRSI